MEFFINLPVAGVNAAITDHFVMFFRDVTDQAFDELHNRKSFFHTGVIFMTVVMEGNKVAIVFINPGSGNHRASELTPDVFYYGFGGTFVWICIDVEAVFVFAVTAGLNFFEGGTNSGFPFIQKGGAERIMEESIVKVLDIAPKTVITAATFRNEAVDVRVPF